MHGALGCHRVFNARSSKLLKLAAPFKNLREFNDLLGDPDRALELGSILIATGSLYLPMTT